MLTAAHCPTHTEPWRLFRSGTWKNRSDVNQFVGLNYSPYTGDAVFLAPSGERSRKIWKMLSVVRERVAEVPRTNPLHLLREALASVGGTLPTGLNESGYFVRPAPGVHQDRLFSLEIRSAFDAGVFVSARDGHSIPRQVLGDYRRVALYGTEFLRAERLRQIKALDALEFTDEVIRQRDRLHSQLDALRDFTRMGARQGLDFSRPASNAREAVEWILHAHLAAVAEQGGAAVQLGSLCAFLDIYIQRDMEGGVLTEGEAQELVERLLARVRVVRLIAAQPDAGVQPLHLDDAESMGDAVLQEEARSRTRVTRTSFRLLHALYQLGPVPELAPMVRDGDVLPQGFRIFCESAAKHRCSVGRAPGGGCPDLAVSHGGAHINLNKALLLSVNGGVDEISGYLVIRNREAFTGDVPVYEDVMARLDGVLDALASRWVSAVNAAHFMYARHERERTSLSLVDPDPKYVLTYGLTGLQRVAQLLAAMQQSAVHVDRDDDGLVTDFRVEPQASGLADVDGVCERIGERLRESVARKLREQRHFPGNMRLVETRTMAEPMAAMAD